MTIKTLLIISMTKLLGVDRFRRVTNYYYVFTLYRQTTYFYCKAFITKNLLQTKLLQSKQNWSRKHEHSTKFSLNVQQDSNVMFKLRIIAYVKTLNIKHFKVLRLRFAKQFCHANNKPVASNGNLILRSGGESLGTRLEHGMVTTD